MRVAPPPTAKYRVTNKQLIGEIRAWRAKNED
jgi:hypothetical protein